ncbi:hypothetical protein AB4H02_004162 [Salmonella enterica]
MYIRLSVGMLITLVGFFCFPANADLYSVGDGMGRILINPEQLKFNTGKAGDTVTMSANSFDSTPFTGRWFTTSKATSVQTLFANFYTTYVSSLPSGTSDGWFKLTDSLEFSAINSYYGNVPVTPQRKLILGQQSTYPLGYNGMSAAQGPWGPWISGTILKFRLTKDAIDTPTYIPAMDLFDYLVLYDTQSSASEAEKLAFLNTIPSPIFFRFSVMPGFIKVPEPMCNVYPSQLDIDFGVFPVSQINEQVIQKTLQMTCNKNSSLKMMISGVGSVIDNGSYVLKANRDDVVVRVKTGQMADLQGYVHDINPVKDIPFSIPLSFEIKSIKSKVEPGNIVSNGWIVFSYE